MNCYRCSTPLPDDARYCMTCGADVSGGSSGERTQPVEVDSALMAKLQEDVGTEYLIERELGRGGMAVVYLATDVHLGRKVAIKVLPPELTFAGGPNIVERFKREARTAATLDHQHIIPIHRVSTGGKLSWYVMKFLEGRTLAEILEQEVPLPAERAADIISQIAQGLEYAHRHGVIHRDVKPANVALDAEGWVTVSDFGIAKALDTSSLTGSGSMLGTPYYMSPEQCAGQKVSGASDQYSLAVVAYQMLSGHLPFTGQAVVDIIKKHCMDSPPPLGVLSPGLPPALVAVVKRGLEKSPGARFASVTEFAAKFAEAVRERVVEATLPVARALPPPRISAKAVVQPAVPPVEAPVVQAAAPPAEVPVVRSVASPADAPVVPPVVKSAPKPAVKPAASLVAADAQEPRRSTPARPPAQRPPVLERRSPYALVSAGIVALGLAGVIFWPLIREALTRPDSAPTAESRRGSEPAASPARPQAALPDSAQPAREPSSVPAPPTAERTGTLVLLGVPRGATVSLDGRRVSGSRIAMQADMLHGLAVAAEGFEPWSLEVDVIAGQSETLTVQMRTLTQASGLRAPTAAAPTPGPPPSQPTRQPAAVRTGVAYITVGSRPQSSIYINGQPVPRNPEPDFEVPAGIVRLRFTVTDSTGTWSYDTTVTVAAGRWNLGRIPLVRRP